MSHIFSRPQLQNYTAASHLERLQHPHREGSITCIHKELSNDLLTICTVLLLVREILIVSVCCNLMDFVRSTVFVDIHIHTTTFSDQLVRFTCKSKLAGMRLNDVISVPHQLLGVTLRMAVVCVGSSPQP